MLGASEDMGGIHGIKAVLLAAKITSHLHITAFRQDALDFLATQATNHVADPFAAA